MKAGVNVWRALRDINDEHKAWVHRWGTCGGACWWWAWQGQQPQQLAAQPHWCTGRQGCCLPYRVATQTLLPAALPPHTPHPLRTNRKNNPYVEAEMPRPILTDAEREGSCAARAAAGKPWPTAWRLLGSCVIPRHATPCHACDQQLARGMLPPS
jgi:hypothetical protein